MIERLLSSIAFSGEFGRQMRFIAGPRQTGKTTVAKTFLKKQGCERLHYNWDERDIRNRYLKNPHFFASDILNTQTESKQHILCMDEIHKYRGWKNILKDFFDTYGDDNLFIVTGSARLDLFRKSGDSLAGRYFMFRLNPLHLRECIGLSKPVELPESSSELITRALDSYEYHQQELESLLAYSGYPEPYTMQSSRFFNKWRNDYVDRIIHEDFRDISQVHDLEKIATLMEVLTERIGSPLSINNLTGDLQCSFQTVSRYLQLMELGYLLFRVKPYSKKITRAINKETKAYFFDWTRSSTEGSRFENFVAMQWKILTDMWMDSGVGAFELRYIRTRDAKETDFLLLRDTKPYLLCEVKLSAGSIERHHLNHRDMILPEMPFVQIVAQEGVAEKKEQNAWQVSASRFFAIGKD
jgi:uncharacterized protein